MSLAADLHWQGSSDRGPGDDRDDLDGYAVVNVNLLARGLGDRLDLRFSIFNLFDEDYAWAGPPTIPDDLTAPGRSFVVGLSFTF